VLAVAGGRPSGSSVPLTVISRFCQPDPESSRRPL
jgi:hypothetical protein